MTIALRNPPRLAAEGALPLAAFGYAGQAGRCETTFPATLAFPRALHPLGGILVRPPRGVDITLWAQAEVLDIGVSPPTPWGVLWGTRLRRPITGLTLWLEGPAAAAYRLRWACCFKLLGHSDPAGPDAWRTGLHGRDPLIALRLGLMPAAADTGRPPRASANDETADIPAEPAAPASEGRAGGETEAELASAGGRMGAASGTRGRATGKAEGDATEGASGDAAAGTAGGPRSGTRPACEENTR